MLLVHNSTLKTGEIVGKTTSLLFRLRLNWVGMLNNSPGILQTALVWPLPEMGLGSRLVVCFTRSMQIYAVLVGVFRKDCFVSFIFSFYLQWCDGFRMLEQERKLFADFFEALFLHSAKQTVAKNNNKARVLQTFECLISFSFCFPAFASKMHWKKESPDLYRDHIQPLFAAKKHLKCFSSRCSSGKLGRFRYLTRD